MGPQSETFEGNLETLIYLDHNSTTPPLPEVVEAMLPFLREKWGNPSSAYRFGGDAKRAIDEARESVAGLVGAKPDQVVFTSSATESNNAALHSALMVDRAKKHIVTSAVEHSAVLAYCEYLKRCHGCEVTLLHVDNQGRLEPSAIAEAIRPDTAVVSLMWANNETGVIWPVTEFAEVCRINGVPFHTDAVQAVGRIPVNFAETGASSLAMSGHKFGAVKGVGALILSEPQRFEPLLHGGKQESGYRGGTESVPFIVALGTAARIARDSGLDRWEATRQLRDEFESGLQRRITGVIVNGGETARLPNTSNSYLPHLDSDAVVVFLDSREICASSGSACMESSISPSHVLSAMTGNHEIASASLRISLGPSNTSSQIEATLAALETFSAAVA